MDHIPVSSLLPDRPLMDCGFYPSSPGDSPPVPSSDARGPSVTFTPNVSVCTGSPFESRQPTPANPVKVLPPAEPPPVIPVRAPPPAEPPPPTLLTPIVGPLPLMFTHPPKGVVIAHVGT